MRGDRFDRQVFEKADVDVDVLNVLLVEQPEHHRPASFKRSAGPVGEHDEHGRERRVPRRPQRLAGVGQRVAEQAMLRSIARCEQPPAPAAEVATQVAEFVSLRDLYEMGDLERAEYVLNARPIDAELDSLSPDVAPDQHPGFPADVEIWD
jgi:hypothetical protein